MSENEDNEQPVRLFKNHHAIIDSKVDYEGLLKDESDAISEQELTPSLYSLYFIGGKKKAPVNPKKVNKG